MVKGMLVGCVLMGAVLAGVGVPAAASPMATGAGAAAAAVPGARQDSCRAGEVEVFAELLYSKSATVVQDQRLSWSASGSGVARVSLRLWAMNGADVPVLRQELSGGRSGSRPVDVAMPNRVAQQWADVTVVTRSGKEARCRVEFDTL